ncbi:hypothetical protein V3C99_010970 [Haemonchus contortus]|uniref:DUF1289 domain-containing protein n=1 Tax=Haemonchus contortus TaxID=6289 RepID=A0A7I4Y711_HAECO
MQQRIENFRAIEDVQNNFTRKLCCRGECLHSRVSKATIRNSFQCLQDDKFD